MQRFHAEHVWKSMKKLVIVLASILMVLFVAHRAEAQRGFGARRANRVRLIQPPLPDGVRAIRDVAYGSDPLQRFDVYAPPRSANAPVIFLVHGGGWRNGDKEHGRLIENKVTRWVPKGIVVISVNYPMLPDSRPLDQARDVARALNVAQMRAAEWGADPSKFVLMGHSAGAHLVSLISTDRSIAPRVSWLGTVSLDGAGFNIPEMMSGPHLPLYDEAFGSDPAYWEATSPYHQLKGRIAPLLAVCSSRRAISCDQSTAFAAKAKALGNRVEVLTEDLSHGEINENLGEPGEYTDAVERFLQSLDRSLFLALR